MHGLQPRSPNDYIALFAAAQLHGYPVFMNPDDRRYTQALRLPRRRRRWLGVVGRARHVTAPASSHS